MLFAAVDHVQYLHTAPYVKDNDVAMVLPYYFVLLKTIIQNKI